MKVNLTVEMSDKEETLAFINFIEQHTNILDWQILTDTSKMYAEDSFYNRITKNYYKVKEVRAKYINDHNYKYE